MWKPNESLDDYKVRPVPEVTSDAPRSVTLEPTGEVEVLQPLARPERRTGFRVFRPIAYQPLWFRRVLVAGSAALVMIALVLVSAILVGINDPSGGPEVAMNETRDDALTQSEELYSFDLSIPLTFLSTTVDNVRSNARRRPARSTIHLASRPRRQLRPPLQPEEPDFVPTTLVIYAENGVINTRIEPWLAADDKKTTSFNN